MEDPSAEDLDVYRPPKLLGGIFFICTLVSAGLAWLVGLEPGHLPFVIALLVLGLGFLFVAVIAWSARIEVGPEEFCLVCLVRRRDVPLASVLGFKINDKRFIMYLQNGEAIKLPLWAADDEALVKFFRKNLQ